MNRHSNGDTCGMTILQANVRRSLINLQLVINFARQNRVDVLLLQEIPRDLVGNKESFCGYQMFRERTSLDPLVAILVARGLSSWSTGCDSDRVASVVIEWGSKRLGVISAYLQHSSGQGLEDLRIASSAMKAMTPRFIIGMDANGHSPLWDRNLHRQMQWALMWRTSSLSSTCRFSMTLRAPPLSFQTWGALLGLTSPFLQLPFSIM